MPVTLATLEAGAGLVLVTGWGGSLLGFRLPCVGVVIQTLPWKGGREGGKVGREGEGGRKEKDR